MTPPTPQDGDYFRLRAEWLRFKSHVFDANTELPTLAAVLDDVRRLMEERGSLGLIYLDLAADSRLESVHGWQAYDAVLRAFGRTLLSLRTQSHLAPRDVVAVMTVRSDKFLVFVRGGDNTSPDAGSLESRARRLEEKLAEVLPDHLPPGFPGPVSFHMGHAVMYRDPMLRAERSIHRALDEAMFMSLRQRTRDQDRRAQGLDEVLARQQIAVLYQPIMDLDTRQVIGHEVFSRGPAGSPYEDAERLFALAERTGRLVELERACRARVLASARRHLAPGAKLFLNTSYRALRDPDVAGPGFVRLVEAHGLSHQDVVLEIAERVTKMDREPYQQVLRELKAQGFGIAVDDMGAGYSSLQSLVELEPDFLKFDVALVRHIDRSTIKRSLLETLVDLAERIGARVVAEGIEEEAELATLQEMRVPLGQGRFLAAPALVPEGQPA